MPRKATPGTIFEIALPDGQRAYARELRHPFVAVYDGRNLASTDTAGIVASRILFVVAVHDSVFREWKKVAFQPLADGEINIPDQFMQDIADPNKCRIVGPNGDERKATPRECQGLERVAVWESDHVAEHISAHYAGRPSEFLESLKLQYPEG